MKFDKELEAGEKIEIEFLDDKENVQYLSKVEEVIDNKTFIISRPMRNRELANLKAGEIIKVAYFREEALYYFKAKVLEQIRSDETVSAKLLAVSDRYRLQRRNYYRLSVIVPIVMVLEEGKERIVKRYDTLDISGGGLRVNTDLKFSVGKEVWLYLDIPEIKEQAIRASVVRSEPSIRHKNLYETALEYKDIDHKTRAVIIRYIFTRQRHIIKKGVR